MIAILLALALSGGPHHVAGTVQGATVRGVAAWTWGDGDGPTCAALSAAWACDVDGAPQITVFVEPDGCRPPTMAYTVNDGPPVAVPLALPAGRACAYLPQVTL